MSNEQDMVKKLLAIAHGIYAYDETLCTEHFLTELLPMLPNPQMQGKLNQHKTEDEASLALLHPADRFLVELMKIEHLTIRVNGMLFRGTFAEIYSALVHVSSWVERCSDGKMDADGFCKRSERFCHCPSFRESSRGTKVQASAQVYPPYGQLQ